MVRFRKKLRICLVVKDELERVFLLKISFLFNFLTRARERMFRMKNFRSIYRKILFLTKISNLIKQFTILTYDFTVANF